MFDDGEKPAVEMPQRSLKTSREVAKASVTRKINEVSSLMCAVENANVVIAHFRVALSLSIKARPGAQPFI